MRHCSGSKLFLWLSLQVILLQSTCRYVVGEQCKSHVSKDLEEGCCITITVRRGYQPVMCSADGENASFEPCPPNTHQSRDLPSSEFHMCDRHSTCLLPNMITKRHGNSTSNTICQCNEAEGYYDTRSDTAAPLQPYNCLPATTVSHLSSSVHQSSSVHTVTPGYPAETLSAIPTSVHLTGSFWLVVGACFVTFVVLVAFAVVIHVYRKKKLKKKCEDCLACNERMDEIDESAPNVVVDQRSIRHNGHIERSDATETGAHSLIESSNVPEENGCDSDAMVNLNLQSDDDNSAANHPASLCYLHDS